MRRGTNGWIAVSILFLWCLVNSVALADETPDPTDPTNPPPGNRHIKEPKDIDPEPTPAGFNNHHAIRDNSEFTRALGNLTEEANRRTVGSTLARLTEVELTEFGLLKDGKLQLSSLKIPEEQRAKVQEEYDRARKESTVPAATTSTASGTSEGAGDTTKKTVAKNEPATTPTAPPAQLVKKAVEAYKPPEPRHSGTSSGPPPAMAGFIPDNFKIVLATMLTNLIVASNLNTTSATQTEPPKDETAFTKWGGKLEEAKNAAKAVEGLTEASTPAELARVGQQLWATLGTGAVTTESGRYDVKKTVDKLLGAGGEARETFLGLKSTQLTRVLEAAETQRQTAELQTLTEKGVASNLAATINAARVLTPDSPAALTKAATDVLRALGGALPRDAATGLVDPTKLAKLLDSQGLGNLQGAVTDLLKTHQQNLAALGLTGPASTALANTLRSAGTGGTNADFINKARALVGQLSAGDLNKLLKSKIGLSEEQLAAIGAIRDVHAATPGQLRDIVRAGGAGTLDKLKIDEAGLRLEALAKLHFGVGSFKQKNFSGRVGAHIADAATLAGNVEALEAARAELLTAKATDQTELTKKVKELEEKVARAIAGDLISIHGSTDKVRAVFDSATEALLTEQGVTARKVLEHYRALAAAILNGDTTLKFNDSELTRATKLAYDSLTGEARRWNQDLVDLANGQMKVETFRKRWAGYYETENGKEALLDWLKEKIRDATSIEERLKWVAAFEAHLGEKDGKGFRLALYSPMGDGSMGGMNLGNGMMSLWVGSDRRLQFAALMAGTDTHPISIGNPKLRPRTDPIDDVAVEEMMWGVNHTGNPKAREMVQGLLKQSAQGRETFALAADGSLSNQQRERALDWATLPKNLKRVQGIEGIQPILRGEGRFASNEVIEAIENARLLAEARRRVKSNKMTVDTGIEEPAPVKRSLASVVVPSGEPTLKDWNDRYTLGMTPLTVERQCLGAVALYALQYTQDTAPSMEDLIKRVLSASAQRVKTNGSTPLQIPGSVRLGSRVVSTSDPKVMAELVAITQAKLLQDQYKAIVGPLKNGTTLEDARTNATDYASAISARRREQGGFPTQRQVETALQAAPTTGIAVYSFFPGGGHVLQMGLRDGKYWAYDTNTGQISEAKIVPSGAGFSIEVGKYTYPNIDIYSPRGSKPVKPSA